MENNTAKNKSKVFTDAFGYMVRGYSVIPVGKDKRPLLRSWKQYQTEAADDDQVTKWFTEDYKDANVGIVTGAVSGITVVDVDVYKKPFTHPKEFPPTFTVKTGNGGFQLYYKYHPGLTISANGYPNLPAVDIRSDGGYVVAPPSVTDYVKDGKKAGGEYIIYKDLPLADFPIHMFPETKPKKKMSAIIGTAEGGRNDNIASVTGTLLHAERDEKKWESEVWPAVQRINETFSPPLPANELRTTFESIMNKERVRKSESIISPIQFNDPQGVPAGEVKVSLRKNGNGVPYKDMANVLAVLSAHPYYKGTIRYNEFRQDIEYNGRPLEEGDIIKIQVFMQVEGLLPGISKDAVYSAIAHYANQNKYDEAQDWLKAQVWDGVPRLKNWLSEATGVPDDAYHQGIGAQWFMGLVRRIMEPGCQFDYMLVFVGKQGIGKTSLFRIIGGHWYKSYTGQIDNKDFYLALRGAAIVDLDEGAAMYKSEAIKIKSVITETHDEFRAPYDRVMKKNPRRFVFSMSTNDTEPFRDVTGNRRYWTLDGHHTVNFKWLQENRDQLFAETYHYWKEKIEIPEVPLEDAIANQERHLPDDSWTDIIVNEVRRSKDYCEGNPEFSTTITHVFSNVFPDENLARLGKGQEMRIANIFKKQLGLDKRREMIDGERKTIWRISDEKIEELKKQNAKNTDPMKPFIDAGLTKEEM